MWLEFQVLISFVIKDKDVGVVWEKGSGITRLLIILTVARAALN